MNMIEEAITNWFGERCSTYDEDCPCCNAWFEYDILIAAGVLFCQQEANYDPQP